MHLRPYQQQGFEAALTEFESGKQSTLIVMPTGTGKTVLFGHIGREWARRAGGRVLMVAHREELIFQARDKMALILGSEPEIEMNTWRASRTGLFSVNPALVSSVQTLTSGRKCNVCDGSGRFDSFSLDGAAGEPCTECDRGFIKRMHRFDPREFCLLIFDEAHRATADSYKEVVQFFQAGNPELKILGVTATPDRADKKALGEIFQTVAYEYPILQAIRDGWLVNIRQEMVKCRHLDFSQVRTRMGDLANSELDAVMREEKVVHEVVNPIVEIVGDRPTLIFGASVNHAEQMAEVINRKKPGSAVCITGKTLREARREHLRRYKRGAFQFLVGCDVFLEGFDEPRIRVVAMARPTKSRALYCQAIGRGTRPLVAPTAPTADERIAQIAVSGKPSLLVLDFCGNAGRHKLVSTADILGGDYDEAVRQRAAQLVLQRGGEQNTLALLSEAEELLKQEERRKRIAAAEARRAQQEEQARRRRGFYADEVEYSRRGVDPFDAFGIEPERDEDYHAGKVPTEKQLQVLERYGVNAEGISRRQATAIIEKIHKRRENNLCTYRQAKVLAGLGVKKASRLTFDEARQLLDKAAANGWRLPREPESQEEVPF